MVDHGEVTTFLEDDFAEATGVAVAVRVGVRRVDANGLTVVLDVDEHAVLAEAAGAVLEGRVARQRDRRDVGVPGDGDLLEFTRGSRVAAVADRTLGRPEGLVRVGGTDVDQAAVAVADQCLEVVVLALGLPAVGGHDRVLALLERDALTFLERDSSRRGRVDLRHHGSRRCRRRLLVALLALAKHVVPLPADQIHG